MDPDDTLTKKPTSTPMPSVSVDEPAASAETTKPVTDAGSTPMPGTGMPMGEDIAGVQTPPTMSPSSTPAASEPVSTTEPSVMPSPGESTEPTSQPEATMPKDVDSTTPPTSNTPLTSSDEGDESADSGGIGGSTV